MPPEVFKKTGYDFKFDVFSIGVIMYTMLACDFPFNDNSFQGLSKKIQETEPDYNRLRLKKVSFDAIELIKNMLQKDKVKRFTIQECLEDKWFTLGHDNPSSTNVMQSVVKEDALVCLQS
jgi:serine/threonine protein kinase